MNQSPLVYPKAAVFIDAGHYHYNLFNKWRIDYEKLIQYFENIGHVVSCVFYYEGMPSKNSYFSSNPNATFSDLNSAQRRKKGYFQKLRSFGFIIRHKPVRQIYDKETSQYKFKCNFDVEITIDVMDTFYSKNIDVFILCSGDGDFEKLIRHIKNKGKKTIVVGLSKSMNDNLAKTAHNVIFLDVIRQKIEY